MSHNGFKVMFRNLAGERASGWTRLGRGLSRWHKKLNEVKASASKALLRAGEGWGVLGMPPGGRDGVRFFTPSPAYRKLSFLTCSVLLRYNLPFLKEEHVMTHSQQNTESTVSKTLSSEVSKNAIEVARKLQKIKEYNDQIDELKRRFLSSLISIVLRLLKLKRKMLGICLYKLSFQMWLKLFRTTKKLISKERMLIFFLLLKPTKRS